MVKITDTAKEKIFELMQMANPPAKGVELKAEQKSPLHIEFDLAFVRQNRELPDHKVIDFGDFSIFVGPESIELAEDATIDFDPDPQAGGFNVDAPPKDVPEIDGDLLDKLQNVFEEMINPALGRHGGFATLLDVKEDSVYLELGGGCKGCGMVDVTLKQGIEEMINEYVPEINHVYDVTDHASGDNPYYQPTSK